MRDLFAFLSISGVGDCETQTTAQQLAEFRVGALGREELHKHGLKTAARNNEGRVVTNLAPTSVAKPAKHTIKEEVTTLASGIRDDQRT